MKYKKNSFIVIPNKEFLKGQPGGMQAVYIWICEHADGNGQCFPSRKTLAEEAGINIKTLDKHLDWLISQGFIEKISRFNEDTGEQTSNIYQIMIIDYPAPKTVHPPVPNLELPDTKNGTPPSPENGTPPSPENGTLTKSILTKPTELIPNWIKKEIWDKWVEHRKQIKKKLTPLAIEEQIQLLSENKEDYIQIINNSVRNGWTGLFPLKGDNKVQKPYQNSNHDSMIEKLKARTIK